MGNVEIILHGTQNDEPWPQTSGTSVGTKAIGESYCLQTANLLYHKLIVYEQLARYICHHYSVGRFKMAHDICTLQVLRCDRVQILPPRLG